jgi:hypothetical protein
VKRAAKPKSTEPTTIPIDEIDPKIVRLLSRDCRTPYLNMASTVGITPHAIKIRINKMLAHGISVHNQECPNSIFLLDIFVSMSLKG